MQRTTITVIDGKRVRESDKAATERFRRREKAIWDEVWTTPQAAAWAKPRWQWLWPTIAEFCRLKAVVDAEPDANAALVAQLHRYRDQIGLTKAGMRELGWDIAADELAEKREETSSAPAVEATSSRSRMKVVTGNGGR
ncbi:MAG: hypothetical protein FWF90_11455 [Promicromonosporaceae bacterium]|nr:hypothetical protein [Promicromonosporaceae bacterium]